MGLGGQRGLLHDSAIVGVLAAHQRGPQLGRLAAAPRAVALRHRPAVGAEQPGRQHPPPERAQRRLGRQRLHAAVPAADARPQPPPGLPGRPGRAAGESGRVSHKAARARGISGAVVTAARRSAGLTRRTLARRLGISPATVRAGRPARSLGCGM